MSSSPNVALLITALQHMRITTYFDVSSFVILIYDYCLTFNMERSLLWTSPWSVAKVLFLLTRYLPFVDTTIVLWHQFKPLATNQECLWAYKSTGWLITIGILIAEIVLALRAWAIWDRKKIVAIGLTIWTAAMWIPDFALMGIFLNTLKFQPLPSPRLTGCLVSAGSTILSVNWILLMVYEAGILLLLIVKALRQYQMHGNSDIYKAVYRDGSLFYLYVFILSTANLVVIMTLPHDFLNTLSSIERVLHSVLTGRILLNLRKVGRYGPAGTVTDTWGNSSHELAVFGSGSSRRHNETITGF